MTSKTRGSLYGVDGDGRVQWGLGVGYWLRVFGWLSGWWSVLMVVVVVVVMVVVDHENEAIVPGKHEDL